MPPPSIDTPLAAAGRTPRLALPGFFPDPSLCRRGEDYYLVSSTFGYFPGLPIHHSRDLVHWTLLGHALDRSAQLPLAGAPVTMGGIYAPTIRYHDNRFWIACTNVTHGGHFLLHATDPAGPWSEPIWIDDAHQGGIDPDLFWDADGTCWFSCTRRDRAPAEPHHGIWQFPIDPFTGRGLGPRTFTWGGTGGKSPEGPHLYHIHGCYYLLAAEGGTEYGHMVTLARGPSASGPWESCPRNPILTHRSIGAKIQSLGHADLFQDADGAWWVAFLGVRPVGYPHVHHLGRETFLAPVEWDADGWPMVNSGKRIEPVGPVASISVTPPPFAPGLDLWRHWSCLRSPAPLRWSLEVRPGWLRLWPAAMGLDAGRPAPEFMAVPPWELSGSWQESFGPVAFLGVRQRHFAIQAAVTLDFPSPPAAAEAGLAVFMSERCHYALSVQTRNGSRVAVLTRRVLDLETHDFSPALAEGPVRLEITSTAVLYSFAVRDAAGVRHVVGTGLSRLLSTEVAGGFTGVFLGLYVSAASIADASADFSDFTYANLA